MSYEGFKCILSLFYGGRVCSTQHSAEIRSDDLHIIATRIERSNYSERGRDIRLEWSLLETEGRENAGQHSRLQYIACLVCVAVVVRVRGLNVNLSRLRFVPVHCTLCTRALATLATLATLETTSAGWRHCRPPLRSRRDNRNYCSQFLSCLSQLGYKLVTIL